jgi:molecular chaperone DnaK
MLQDMGDKISAADKATVEGAITELKNAVSSNDPAAMNRAMEQLTQAQHRVAESLYKQTGSTAGPGPQPGTESAGGEASTGGAPGDVIDAEVVEDEKK